MFGSRKINSLIDFPVTGLDLSTYVLSGQGNASGLGDSSQSKPESQVYDLYAVSNHYGTMNGGHYTAMCHNVIKDAWYEFDDSSVSKIGSSGSEVQSGVCSKAAYVLFYKRRRS